MSYIALYRKYRPKKFEEVVGQDTTVKILRNSIIEGKVGHAYLFSGPRGTGKTSIAKIFAKAVNCLNPLDGDLCGNCENCIKMDENDIDIIEIDAASNNGVDEIREIRSNTKLMPNIGQYKIYIIDEVHMLSTGAFNALLKTLEEPPRHVIFILATTEIQKIPLTIISRCQRFDFHKIQKEVMLQQLKNILSLENRKVDESILELIVDLSDGCCRDAINLLDQILSMEIVSEQDVYDLAGEVPDTVIYDMINYIISKDYENGLTLIDKMFKNGSNINNIINKMLIILRNISVSKKSAQLFSSAENKIYSSFIISNEDIIKTIKILLEFNSELKKTTMQKILFEIYYMQMCDIFDNNELNLNTPIENEYHIKNTAQDFIKKANTDDKIDNKLFEIRIGNVLSTADKKILNDVKNKYKGLDEFASNRTFNNAVSILSDGQIVAASKEYLLLAFNYDSTVSLFIKNLSEVEELINLIVGEKYKLVGVSFNDWEMLKKEYVRDKSKFKYQEEEYVKKDLESNIDKEVDTVFDIFGEDAVTIK